MNKPIGTPVNGDPSDRSMAVLFAAVGVLLTATFCMALLLRDEGIVVKKLQRENAELRSRRIEVIGGWPNEYRLRWVDAQGIETSEPAIVSTRLVCEDGRWALGGEIRLRVESDADFR